MKIKKYFSALKKIDINHYRILHGLKTAFACLIGLAIEKHYKWPMGQWVPITIMVVMSAQTHFGGAVRKAAMRFLGTICGVGISIAVLWFFGSNLLVVFCTIFVTGVFFTYIASSHQDISYAGTLGGVTVILVLTGQQVGIETALQRGFYIVLGIIIALVVSRFVFPIHARDRLRYHVAITLRNLSQLYLSAVQVKENSPAEDSINIDLNSQVIDDITAQPRLVYEAVVGSRMFASHKEIYKDIIDSEQSLSRLINLIYLSLREMTTPSIIKQQLSALGGLHTIVSENLCYLADCFESKITPQKIDNLGNLLSGITQAVANLPPEKEIRQLLGEHSFLFLIEQVLQELENLRDLIKKVNGKT